MFKRSTNQPQVKDKKKPGRYTPKSERPASYRSPTWVAVLMFVLLGLGVLVIILNYLTVLPGGASNYYLLVGLVLLGFGFWVATRYQ
jgi:hypothetical protein